MEDIETYIPPNFKMTDKQEGEFEDKLTVIEKIARSVVLRPCGHYCCSWLIVAVIILITFAAGLFNITDFGDNDWIDAYSSASKNYDAYQIEFKHTDTANFFKEQSINFRSQPVFYGTPTFLYNWADHSRDDDIFTPENVQLICEFERLMFSHPEFPLFCITNNASGTNTNCDFSTIPLISAAFYNYSLDIMSECSLLDAAAVEQIRTSLINSDDTLFLFAKEVETDRNASSATARSILPLGGPLGLDSTNGEDEFTTYPVDSEEESYHYYEDFMLKIVDILDNAEDVKDTLFKSGYMNPLYLGHAKELRVRYYASSWEIKEFNELFPSDMIIVIFAILLVGILMIYHTGSVFVTGMGTLTNLSSIPVGLFIYAGICQINYFTALHIVVLFLIIGIGADNIFVMFDAWKQSATLWPNATRSKKAITTSKEAEDVNRFSTNNGDDEILIYRLVYTLTTAAPSIFNTMFTTFAAFLATLSNPMAPIAGFGAYASLVIFSNFIFVFVLVTPMLLIYHDTFSKMKCCFGLSNYFSFSKSSPRPKPTDTNEEEYKPALEDKLFEKGYVPLMIMNIKWLPWLLILGNLGMTITFATKAAKLSLPDEFEELYKKGHMYYKFFEDYSVDYAGGGGDDFLDVSFTFGIKGIDRNGFRRLNVNGFRGEPVLDSNFDIAPSQNQDFLLDFCTELRSLSCIPNGHASPLKGCQGVEPNLIAINGTLRCLMEEFYGYSEKTFNTTEREVKEIGDTDPNKFYEMLLNFSLSENNFDLLGFEQNKISFLAVEMKTSMLELRPGEEKAPVNNLILDFVKEKRKIAPNGLKSINFVSLDYAFIVSQEEMIPNMFLGFAISLPVAFAVLLLGTENWILSLLALISIGMIIVCILGTINALGWTLGYVQSIAAIMVVGLSVDYCIHIGHMYEVAGSEGHGDRVDRFTIAAVRMGPTVFAGYITTATAAAVMFLCQIALFPIMATLIFFTVTFSLEMTLGFYLPLCLLFGPENDTGKIEISRLWKKCKKGDKQI